jgi:hypothetical protein
MQQSRVFGRRDTPSTAEQKAALKLRAEALVETREIARIPSPVLRSEDAVIQPLAREPPPLEEELQEWKAARKRRKRSFREPWRSVSIAAGLGFAATSWIVPDSVANVTEVALGVLTAGSLYAGWRGRKTLASVEAKTADPHS